MKSPRGKGMVTDDCYEGFTSKPVKAGTEVLIWGHNSNEKTTLVSRSRYGRRFVVPTKSIEKGLSR
jgi:hypothetical protein